MGKANRIKKEKEKEKENIIQIIENHEILELTDFWSTHQTMRENFYFLCNLKESLNNIICISPAKKFKDSNLIYDSIGDIDSINEKIKKFNAEIDILTSKCELLDNINPLNTSVDFSHIEAATTKDTAYNTINTDNSTDNSIVYFKNMIECINLSEQLEKTCNDILQFQYFFNTKNNEILSIKKNDLKLDFILRKRTEIFKFGLDSNIEKDKIINYEIKCDSKAVIQSLSSTYNIEVLESSFIVKKVDLRYINLILQQRVLDEYKETGSIFKRSINITRSNQLKVLNKIIFYIGTFTFAFQLLNLPSYYSNFYLNLRPYLQPMYIKSLAFFILIFTVITIIVAELTLFKDFKKNDKDFKENGNFFRNKEG